MSHSIKLAVLVICAAALTGSHSTAAWSATIGQRDFDARHSPTPPELRIADLIGWYSGWDVHVGHSHHQPITFQDSGVTVRGEFVIDSKSFGDIDWSNFEAIIQEQVRFLSPSFPENWAEMNTADRARWLENFWASEDGKTMRSKNQALSDKRRTYPITIEKDGSFVVYDIEKGKYGLRANMEVKADNKRFLLESAGQFEVGDVNEIDLSRMPIDVLRSLAMDEEAPEIKVADAQGNMISLNSLRGQHVLLSFGAVTNPSFKAATDAMKDLKQTPELQNKLRLLTISVDSDKQSVAKILQRENFTWQCGLLGGFDQEVLGQYGLKSVPSFWLIDPTGKIVLTGRQFLIEINRQKTTIQQLVRDAVDGKLVIDADNENGDGKDDDD